MHRSVRQWVQRRASGATGAVLEVGSFDVNGGVRDLFDPASTPTDHYLGVDLRPGPGVDVVLADGAPLPAGPWDLVLCLEVLEHDPAPWHTIADMARVLRPGGTLLLTTRGPGFPFHDHPSDYWRFTQDGIRLLVERAGLDVVELVDDPQSGHPGVFCAATRREV